MQAAHTEIREGFEIALYLEEEYDSPEGHFDMGEEANAEVLEGIASGRYLWFCARVTASKEDVMLAESFLGGCCYESVADFTDEDGYWGDMVREVIDEARATISKLCKG